MKTIILLSFTLSSFFADGQTLEDFQWLLGKWERQGTKAGSYAVEVWSGSAQSLNGYGMTMKEQDTVFVEKLRIVNRKGTFYYVAEVEQNAEPTYFKITLVSKSGFVCEKPEHDFPKKIEYALKGNEIIATISGNGKEIPFRFKRLDD